MPVYPYRCPEGHVTELVQKMSDPTPSVVECDECDCNAQRVFTAPAAIHYKGRGFYSTDVVGSQERRRRPNPGDDLHREHDQTAANIARSL